MMNNRRIGRPVGSLILVVLSTAAAQAGEPQLSGRLETAGSVRVLTLWGGDYDRGFAHGYLLAEDIVGFIGEVVLDPRVLRSREAYHNRIVGGLLSKMDFAPRYERELEGMLAGIAARLGPHNMFSPALGRVLSLDDLKAINTLADWYAFYCSSFSVWGDLQAGGQVATARNLDFLKLSGIIRQQMIMVHKPAGDDRRKWVSVGWASIIGCYTGMNENGVTVTMHDCPPGMRSVESGFVPRSLALRDAIESASAAGALDDVERELRRRPALFGNNVHVSRPFTGGGDSPAAIFEYDPDGRVDGGVTRRTANQDGQSLVEGAVVCTNHYRRRARPVPCPRYDRLAKSLLQLAAAKGTVDRRRAFELLGSVRVSDANKLTTHAVYMLPNTRELFVSLATEHQAAPNDNVAHFTLTELLKQ